MTKRFNPYGHFVGSWIPDWLIGLSEISAGAKLCYSRLARFAGKDGACYPRQETLAVALGVSDRQVRTYLAELKAYELIEEERVGQGSPNRYYFLRHAWMASTSDQDRKDTSTLDRNDASAPIKEKELRDTPLREDAAEAPLYQTEVVFKAKKKTKHSLPEDFEPSEAWRAYALTKGFSSAEAWTMWEAFEAHHRAHGTVFLDWDRAWQTWVLREVRSKQNQTRRENAQFRPTFKR